MISVVLKGGRNTMENVGKRLDDGDPVILLHKSGGAATTIASVLIHVKRVPDSAKNMLNKTNTS